MIGNHAAATQPLVVADPPLADRSASLPPGPVLDPATGVLSGRAWAARTGAVLSGHLAPDAPGWAVLTVEFDQHSTTASAAHELRPPRPLDRISLTAAGRALMIAAGPRALVGRLAGSGFVVLAASRERSVVHAVAEKLRRAVASLHDQTGTPLGVTASVGAALLPDRPQAADITAAFWAADAALYNAKRAGQDTVRVS
jgi:hypothetical protein